jgi:hypothetical protein
MFPAFRSRSQDHFRPVVRLVAEVRIGFGRLIQRQAVADQEGGVDLPIRDALQKAVV